MPVTDVHPDYKRFLPMWQLCRDVTMGDEAIKASGRREIYLPPLPGHKRAPGRYNAYVEAADFYNATGRTHGGLRGLVERKDADVDAPDAMAAFVDDCTGTGTSVQEFAGQVVDELLRVGRCGILTDYPDGTNEGKTTSQVRKEGRRPYWTLYTAESIRNWYPVFVKEGGSWKLVKLILEEVVEVQGEDEFDRVMENRYRVLELEPLLSSEGELTGFGNYRQRSFHKKKAGDGEVSSQEEYIEVGEPVVPMMSGKPLREIPFVFINARATSWEPSKPPLYDLARKNLAHYRNSASLEAGLLLAGSPTPWITGWKPSVEEVGRDGSPPIDSGDETLFEMGGGHVWTIQNENAKVGLLSVPADALGALEKALDRKDGHMIVLGARVIESEERPAESGVAKRADDDRDASQLATISKMGSKGMTRALSWARDWIIIPVKRTAGSDTDDVGVTLNTDFFGKPMSPDEIRATVDLWQKDRLISKADVRRLMRRGEWLPYERTDEMIDDELEAEGATLPSLPPGQEESLPSGI